MIELRPYQTNALGTIWAYFSANGKEKNPLVVAPTGSGKSLIIAGFCEHVQKMWPDQRILIFSHVKEILSQNKKAIQQLLPETEIGFYAAGLNHKDIAPITLASIQSAYNNMEIFKENFDIVLVDECHLIPHRGQGRYRTMIQALDKPTIGFTATPFRLGTGYLHLGEGSLFHEIIYNIRIKDLIELGHLCPVAAKGTHNPMDPTGIRKSGGDYVVSALADRFNKEAITERIVQELLIYKDLRKKWLLFAINIEHADYIANCLNKNGIVAKSVHSKMKGSTRGPIIEQFKTDPALQALVSVAVLTTGFDAPQVDLIGLLRPTDSPVLHIQIIGRGLRPAPGKKDCLVLDFAGNLLRNGPIDNPDIRTAGRGNGDPIMKQCPKCFEIVYSAVRLCPVCNHEFLFAHHLHAFSDLDGQVLAGEDWHEVVEIAYETYFSRSGYWMLKVNYQCAFRVFSEYIAVEHSGYARFKAEHWWRRRDPNTLLPPTAEEALAFTPYLKQPTRIFVDESGKYPNIKKQEFKN